MTTIFNKTQVEKLKEIFARHEQEEIDQLMCYQTNNTVNENYVAVLINSKDVYHLFENGIVDRFTTDYLKNNPAYP